VPTASISESARILRIVASDAPDNITTRLTTQ